MTTDKREVHSPKHACSILVTEDGMVMEVRAEQPQKQYFPKTVTEEGIIVLAHPATRVFVAVSTIALQFSLES